MQVKVCGLKYQDNLLKVVDLKPDYVGFIFYEKSKRAISKKINYKELALIPDSIQKVGVFVNEHLEEVEKIFRLYSLDYVQLHGDENPDYCRKLKRKGIQVIKSFSISDKQDFDSLANYSSNCDYFLFDTKGFLRGGNGIKFNWKLLEYYVLDTPFFLSGGISIDDVKELKNLSHSMLHAIDINSRFEISPGVKDIHKLKIFLKEIKQKDSIKI